MRLNDHLVRHYLATSLVMRLATVTGRGSPSLTPIWFVTVNGRLVSATGATTVAARNIAAQPRVAVLLDGEAAGQSGFDLRLRGTARVHQGMPPLGVLARFAAKYYLSPGGLRCELAHADRWKLRMRYYAQSDPVWLSIEPVTAELIPAPHIRRDQPGHDTAAADPLRAPRPGRAHRGSGRGRQRWSELEGT